jgi:hypothetical protein
MISWSHCFGPVERQPITVGVQDRANCSSHHDLKAKERRKKDWDPIIPSRACLNDLKTSH